jgi:Fur family ferric uptake transcriptional regulator
VKQVFRVQRAPLPRPADPATVDGALSACYFASSSQYLLVRKVGPDAELDDAALTRALACLDAAVRARGLKSSTTRAMIARAALRRRDHFSVEELLADLRADGVQNVHAATVYRVLPLLVDAGLLQVTLVSHGESTRYERAFERQHHDHLICTTCGVVVEFEFDAIESLQHDVAERFGFSLEGHVHELLGTCPQCRARA